MIACGSITMITSRRYMSITYGESAPSLYDSWIVFPGQLVKIRSNCLEQSQKCGIIIECTCPDFGLGSDKWLVLVEGKLLVIESFCIWPVKEN